MTLKDRWIKFIYNFIWFSKIYYILTMKVSQAFKKCEIPNFTSAKEIKLLLSGGKLYKSDNVAQVFKDYLIHPRVIQCRLNSQTPFGDCDDHAIYWCTGLKKSNLVKRVWFSFFTMKGRWPDDTYSSHAVCVFLDKNERLYWCDYSEPKLIENLQDFQIQSAKLYGCEAVCGGMWEVIEVKSDDTPVFGESFRILPLGK